MAACRRVACFAQRSRFLYLKSNRRMSAGSVNKESVDEVNIPYRIERSPTAILEALASTISKDHTAAHYKYEDDPYLIPSSNITKRAFALSKESGKKAARYFLEKYPELFAMNKSEPHVKAFDSPITYTEENVSSVESLSECIQHFDVENSLKVYDILNRKEVTIDHVTKQDFLELLCFTNGKHLPNEDYYEERYFARSQEIGNEKWDPKGMAEKMFAEMEKDSKSYSAMICGCAKFHNAERAFELHEEMRANQIYGTVEAYNSMISVIPFLKDEGEARWEMATYFLSVMRVGGVMPDVCTINALLHLLTKNSRWKKINQLSLGVLAEMRKLKIEPSLGTYYYLIMVFCSNNFERAGILYDIINDIEGKEFKIRHPSDVSFFATAMECCWKGLNDKDLAYRIHALLEFKNNCKMLGNAFSEQQYFKCFFRCLCENEDVEKVMEIYEKYVPNTYTPEPSVTLAVLKAVHLVGAYSHLPRLCQDVLLFEQTERQAILEMLMEAAGCMKHEEQTQSNIVSQVWNIVEKINSRKQVKRSSFDWDGKVLGNILSTFVNGKDMEKSWSIIEQLKQHEMQIIGYPPKENLIKFCEFCIETSNYEKLSYCIKYAKNGSYPGFDADIESLIQDLVKQQKVEEKQIIQLNWILQSGNIDDATSDSSSGSDTSGSESSDSDSETTCGDDENGEKLQEK